MEDHVDLSVVTQAGQRHLKARLWVLRIQFSSYCTENKSLWNFNLSDILNDSFYTYFKIVVLLLSVKFLRTILTHRMKVTVSHSMLKHQEKPVPDSENLLVFCHLADSD